MDNGPLTQQYKFTRISRNTPRLIRESFRGHGPQLLLLLSQSMATTDTKPVHTIACVAAGYCYYEHFEYFHNCQMVISLTSKTVLKADRGRWQVKNPRYNRLTWAEVVDDITTTYDFSNMKWIYLTRRAPDEAIFLAKAFGAVELDSLTFLEWLGEYDNRPLKADSTNMLKLIHPELVPLLTAHHPRSSE